MSTGHEMALYTQQLEDRLAHADERFNALGQITKENLPRVLLNATVPILSIASGCAGAYAEAKLGPKGAIGNGVVAGMCWIAGAMMPENPDVRNLLYGIAGGLGTAAAAIPTYNWVKDRGFNYASNAAAQGAPVAPTAVA